MATRSMAANELFEYYTLYAAVGLSRMNQGQDIQTSFSFDGTDITSLVGVACRRARIKVTDPATLTIDTATLVPDAAAITALT